jgi:hypothetical protein
MNIKSITVNIRFFSPYFKVAGNGYDRIHYLRDIRKSLKLDITGAMLVTYVQKDHPSLSIIKFDKRGMFWHCSPKTATRTGNGDFTSDFWLRVMLETEISVV